MFNANPLNLLFLASLDGMLCVCLMNTCELVVWNPLTRVYKMLSNAYSQGFYKISTDAIGFFVDSLDHHIIMHIKRRRGTMTIWIYSLRFGHWRTCCFLKKRPFHELTYHWIQGILCGTGLYFTVCQWWIGWWQYFGLMSTQGCFFWDILSYRFGRTWLWQFSSYTRWALHVCL